MRKTVEATEVLATAIYSKFIPEGYIAGLGRDYPHPLKSHLYHGDFQDPGLPMCKRGWNRDNGQSYSIWRGNIGEAGICQICLNRAKKGLSGIPAELAKLEEEKK